MFYIVLSVYNFVTSEINNTIFTMFENLYPLQNFDFL